MGKTEKKDRKPTQIELDNLGVQKNKNHPTFYKNRGKKERPENWEELAAKEEK